MPYFDYTAIAITTSQLSPYLTDQEKYIIFCTVQKAIWEGTLIQIVLLCMQNIICVIHYLFSLTSGCPAKGNATVELQVQPPNFQGKDYPTLTRKIPYVSYASLNSACVYLQ